MSANSKAVIVAGLAAVGVFLFLKYRQGNGLVIGRDVQLSLNNSGVMLDQKGRVWT